MLVCFQVGSSIFLSLLGTSREIGEQQFCIGSPMWLGNRTEEWWEGANDFNAWVSVSFGVFCRLARAAAGVLIDLHQSWHCSSTMFTR